MRKLILYMGVSIDGFVARPDGAAGWGTPPEDDALPEHKVALLRSVGAHVMGRQTYVDMASAWPGSDGPIAAAMNEIPKVVFSRTLTTADWPESTIASGPLSEEVARLKQEPGADLMAHGGATFAPGAEPSWARRRVPADGAARGARRRDADFRRPAGIPAPGPRGVTPVRDRRDRERLPAAVSAPGGQVPPGDHGAQRRHHGDDERGARHRVGERSRAASPTPAWTAGRASPARRPAAAARTATT